MRRLLVILALALLALPLGGATGPSPPTFRAAQALPFSENINMPSLAVDGEGYLFVGATGGATALWRSLDGGQTWTRQDDTGGFGGGSDVATDADGRVYAVDASFNVPVSASSDNGSTWSSLVHVGAGSNGADRPWLAAHGHGNAWAAWLDSGTERVARSHDGGLSWTRKAAAFAVSAAGRPFAASDSDLYLPYTSGNFVLLAISHDGGSTWQTTDVGLLATAIADFPAVARDDAGTLYYTWADFAQPRGVIHVSRSSDDGDTWTDQQVSDSADYAIFPTIAAGKAGRVAIAWYDGRAPLLGQLVGSPDAAATAAWRVKVATAPDADAASPTWTLVNATDVIHRGSVCDFRGSCSQFNNPAALSRALGDAFQIAPLPDGRVAIAYTADVANDPTFDVELRVVVQDGGATLR